MKKKELKEKIRQLEERLCESEGIREVLSRDLAVLIEDTDKDEIAFIKDKYRRIAAMEDDVEQAVWFGDKTRKMSGIVNHIKETDEGMNKNLLHEIAILQEYIKSFHNAEQRVWAADNRKYWSNTTSENKVVHSKETEEDLVNVYYRLPRGAYKRAKYYAVQWQGDNYPDLAKVQGFRAGQVQTTFDDDALRYDVKINDWVVRSVAENSDVEVYSDEEFKKNFEKATPENNN